MKFPLPGIGVVFDIDELGGGAYGYRAWQIFMKHINLRKLGVAIFVEGDTNATLARRADEYCIGVYTWDESVIEYIRSTFEAVKDPGLAAFHRRFIEKIALDEQPLVIRGQIDAFRRLVTDFWSRTDHDLCKQAGWGYAPREVPQNLDQAILNELEELG